jgi:hypothetical protein
MNNRMQLDLRALIKGHQARGWEIVSREPLTLTRIGCKLQMELRAGLLVMV